MRKLTIRVLLLASGMMACSIVPFLGAQEKTAIKPGSEEAVCSELRMMRFDHLPPFIVIRKETMERKLPDGTTVRQERLTKDARDSQGRHYEETRIPSRSNSDDPIYDDVLVHVEDPVGNAWIRWDVEKQEATITRFQPRNQQPRPQPPNSDSGGRSFVALTMTKNGVPVQTEHRSEDLGVRVISGTEACGSRDTETYPPGTRMNDKPVTVVRESWFSPELGIQVRSVVEDPGFGVDTREILGLDRGEPDAGLFRVPEGYRVKENLLQSAN